VTAWSLAGRAQLLIRVEEDGAGHVAGVIALTSGRTGDCPPNVRDAQGGMGEVGRQPLDADDRARKGQHGSMVAAGHYVRKKKAIARMTYTLTSWRPSTQFDFPSSAI